MANERAAARQCDEKRVDDFPIRRIPADEEKFFAQVQGLRYEDFLPVSAAGIFASNLNQMGAKSTAVVKPVYTRAMFEEILGKPVIDSDAQYRSEHEASIAEIFAQLGLPEPVTA